MTSELEPHSPRKKVRLDSGTTRSGPGVTSSYSPKPTINEVVATLERHLDFSAVLSEGLWHEARLPPAELPDSALGRLTEPSRTCLSLLHAQAQSCADSLAPSHFAARVLSQRLLEGLAATATEATEEHLSPNQSDRLQPLVSVLAVGISCGAIDGAQVRTVLQSRLTDIPLEAMVLLHNQGVISAQTMFRNTSIQTLGKRLATLLVETSPEQAHATLTLVTNSVEDLGSTSELILAFFSACCSASAAGPALLCLRCSASEHQQALLQPALHDILFQCLARDSLATELAQELVKTLACEQIPELIGQTIRNDNFQQDSLLTLARAFAQRGPAAAKALTETGLRPLLTDGLSISNDPWVSTGLSIATTVAKVTTSSKLTLLLGVFAWSPYRTSICSLVRRNVCSQGAMLFYCTILTRDRRASKPVDSSFNSCVC